MAYGLTYNGLTIADKIAGFPGVFFGLSRRLSHGVFSVIRSLTRNSSSRHISCWRRWMLEAKWRERAKVETREAQPNRDYKDCARSASSLIGMEAGVQRNQINKIRRKASLAGAGCGEGVSPSPRTCGAKPPGNRCGLFVVAGRGAEMLGAVG
jgi:hypothetical protein